MMLGKVMDGRSLLVVVFSLVSPGGGDGLAAEDARVAEQDFFEELGFVREDAGLGSGYRCLGSV